MNGSDKASVFVYGYYGLGNLGDDLLLGAIVDQLTKREFADKYFIRNLGVVNGLIKNERIIFTNLEHKLFFYGGATILRKAIIFYIYMREHIKLFGRCHSFILGGGTLLSNRMSLKSLFILTMLVLTAKLQGAKVMALGLGVTNIKGILRRFLVRYILRAASKVCIRDYSSLQACRELTADTSFTLTADLVFSSNITKNFSSKKRITASSPPLTIGITLVEPFLRDNIEGVNEHEVLDVTAAAIKYCLNKGYIVKLIGFQRLTINEVDSFSDMDIFERLVVDHNIVGAELIDVSHSIEYLPALYDELHMVVGMRFHSLVLSALSNISFVGISCDHKISCLCESFGMPCIDVSDISSNRLIESIESARKIKIDQTVLQSFQTNSNLNFSWPNGK